jgi:hypothetical protein
MENVSNCTQKQFCEHTTMLENGFAQYDRPNNGVVVNKKGIDIDNRFVVPPQC